MAALALADVLPDFGSKTPESVNPFGESSDTGGFGPRHVAEANAVAEAAAMEARLEEARQAVREELSRRYAQEIAVEREHHASELNALRAMLGEEAGAKIAAGLGKIEERVVALTTSVATRILGVSLTEDLQRRSIDQLARLIREAMEDREAVRVRISGAPLLFEALKAALGDRAAGFEFSESESFDLSVSIDESIFETRLSEWSDALAEVMP